MGHCDIHLLAYVFMIIANALVPNMHQAASKRDAGLTMTAVLH